MKIYTKTGDKGTTALFGGKRVSKNHLRIESYGTVDELNSYIGLIKDQEIDHQTKNILVKIQNDLFTLGSMLATPLENEILKKDIEIRVERNKTQRAVIFFMLLGFVVTTIQILLLFRANKQKRKANDALNEKNILF